MTIKLILARQSDMEFEKKVCPDCNGGGVYQEYDEYDRYTVHSCATCDGSGEIARQSATSEEVQEAIKQKLITDSFEYLNKKMKQPFVEKDGERNDI